MAWEGWLGRATRKNKKEGETVSVPLGGPAPRGCSWVGRGAEAGSSSSPLLYKGTPGLELLCAAEDTWLALSNRQGSPTVE